MILQKPGAKDPKAECQSVPFHVIGALLVSQVELTFSHLLFSLKVILQSFLCSYYWTEILFWNTRNSEDKQNSLGLANHT